jgi:hypothetical protein
MPTKARANVNRVVRKTTMTGGGGGELDQYLAPEVVSEIEQHKVIRMSACKWFGHCLLRFWRLCCCKCCGKNIPKTYRFQDHIAERLESDMNMVDIIKKVRYMQVMLNSTHLTNEVRRYKLAHTFQSVLDFEEADLIYPKQHKLDEMEEYP